uniref:Uncharacterized protein n=1 Tax=Candidatus Kentrum sp. LFY TaxID=2126342 RepID=A0A450WS65_9GAMM|nr:MAG: hypothetical protein BECKLFY1418C_GA0070996_106422 [Candidatus Kentron sp. LFY]
MVKNDPLEKTGIPREPRQDPPRFGPGAKRQHVLEKPIMPDSHIEKFRNEVETRLNELDKPRLSGAFAVRVALMALPALADRADKEGFLWYWRQEDREMHLLAVCRAVQFGASFSIDFAMISAAANAAYAAAANANANANAAAYAAAARADATLIPSIHRELAALSPNTEPSRYLAQAIELPPALMGLRERFLLEIRRIPSFDYWADWL